MKKINDLTFEEIYIKAIQNQKNNNLQGALDLYNQLLEKDPNNEKAYNGIGTVFHQAGQFKKAIEYYKRVNQINPNHRNSLNNLGAAYRNIHNYQKAIESFEMAIKIDPNFIDAYTNIGITFNETGEYEKAISSLENAKTINPNAAEIYCILSESFKETGNYQKAIENCEMAIKIDPNYADAYTNLGVIFRFKNEIPKAISYFEKALKINPNHRIALGAISSALVGELEDFDKATKASHKALKIYHKQSSFINQSIPLFRLKHDIQQAKYLIKKNYKIDGIEQFQKIGDAILNRKENKENNDNSNKKILLNKNEITDLMPFYKSDFIYKPKTLSGSCINSNKNWLEVEEEYFNNPKQIIYIDDFLSEEALIELREFCLVSKVWTKEYSNKYLGAFLDQGFISPIHLQIAIDLQQKLPSLFGGLKLAHFGGLKYDTNLGKGINIHADFALHNLNFWITPDEYNNDKNSGGLKVYDTPVPTNWTFND